MTYRRLALSCCFGLVLLAPARMLSFGHLFAQSAHTKLVTMNGTQLDGLFAANDEMALGAIKAASTATPAKKIVIVGFDATADGLAAIKDGTLAATVQQDPKEMGRLAVDLAVQLVHGKHVPPETRVPVKLIIQGGE